MAIMTVSSCPSRLGLGTSIAQEMFDADPEVPTFAIQQGSLLQCSDPGHTIQEDLEVGDHTKKFPGNDSGIYAESRDSEGNHSMIWSASLRLEGQTLYSKGNDDGCRELEVDRSAKVRMLSGANDRDESLACATNTQSKDLKKLHQSKQSCTTSRFDSDQGPFLSIRFHANSKSVCRTLSGNDIQTHRQHEQGSSFTSASRNGAVRVVDETDILRSFQACNFERDEESNIDQGEKEKAALPVWNAKTVEKAFTFPQSTQSGSRRKSVRAAHNRKPIASQVCQASINDLQMPTLDQYAWSPCTSDDGFDPSNDSITHYQTDEWEFTPEADSKSFSEFEKDGRKLDLRSPSITPDQSRLVARVSEAFLDSHGPGGYQNKSRQLMSGEEVGRVSSFSSETEAQQTLDDVMNYDVRASSSAVSLLRSQLDSEAFSSRDIIVRIQNPTARDVKDAVALSDPGSSQSTSSVIEERSIPRFSGPRGRANVPETLPFSRFRSSTPPLLFGRKLSELAVGSSSAPRVSISSPKSRFALAIYARNRMNSGYRSDRIADASELDWVTETDMKTTAIMTSDALEALSDSSLADISDASNLSTPKELGSGLHRRRESLHHPLHARYNHSWTLQEDVQSGEVALLPNQMFRDGHRLQSTNAVTHLHAATNLGALHKYRHPAPFRQGHSHPFSSSPPLLAPLRYSPRAQEKSLSADQGMEVSSQSQMAPIRPNTAGSPKPSLGRAGSIFRARGSALDSVQQEASDKPSKSPSSSTWFSTVDEDHSNQPSLPARIANLTESPSSRSCGNLTGTCDGVGVRQVGSSIADQSSPGMLFSSSPALPTVSPRTQVYHNEDDYSDALSISSFSNCAGSAQFQTQEQMGKMIERQHHKLSKNVAALTQGGALFGKPVQSTIHQGGKTTATYRKRRQLAMDCLRSLPSIGFSKRSSGRSSSENVGTTELYPSAAKVSTSPSPISSHRKRPFAAVAPTTEGIPFLEDIENGMPQLEISIPKDYRNRRRDGCKASSCSPVSISHSRTTGINKPVASQEHLVFSLRNFHFRLPTTKDKSRGVSDPVTQPPFTDVQGEAPVAHVEAPRLRRLPCPISPELIRCHKRLSRMYILPCFVPFLGILYGHGILDCVIVWHTHGKIEHFRRQEKIFILVWSYSVMTMLLAGLVLIVILCGF